MQKSGKYRSLQMLSIICNI